MINKNKNKIDNQEEWLRTYQSCQLETLEEYKLIFYNKEHYKNYWLHDSDELDKIKTYNDAILYKNSKSYWIRTLCNHIIKGDIEIYE